MKYKESCKYLDTNKNTHIFSYVSKSVTALLDRIKYLLSGDILDLKITYNIDIWEVQIINEYLDGIAYGASPRLSNALVICIANYLKGIENET